MQFSNIFFYIDRWHVGHAFKKSSLRKWYYSNAKLGAITIIIDESFKNNWLIYGWRSIDRETLSLVDVTHKHFYVFIAGQRYVLETSSYCDGCSVCI